MKITKLEQIISYIKKNEIGLFSAYLNTLDVLEDLEAVEEHNFYDIVCRDMENLIYRYKADEMGLGIETLDGFVSKLEEYQAFVYYLKNVLNKNINKNYEFMLFTTAREDTGASEIPICRKDENHTRYFLMEISENIFGCKSISMVVLCHEIAHYVGSELRSRSQRLQCIYNILGRVIILGIKTSFMQSVSRSTMDLNCNAWDKVEHIIPKWIELYYSREWDKAFIEYTMRKENRDVDDAIAYAIREHEHMHFVMNKIFVAIEEMLKYKYISIFETVFVDGFNDDVDYNEREQLFRDAIYIINRNNSDEYNSVFTVRSALEHCSYIMKEAYADLISIWVLDITLEEYLDTIIKQFRNISLEQFGIKICARIAVVINVMKRRILSNDEKYYWTEESCDEAIAGESDISKLMIKVDKFTRVAMMKSYFDSEKNIGELVYKNYSILYDYRILEQIVNYLMGCKRQFINLIEDKDLDILREFYRNEDNSRLVQGFDELMRGLYI